MPDVNTIWKDSLPHIALSLSQEDVHVWRIDIAQPPAIVQPLRDLLSADENAKADRFHFEKDRQRYIVSHAVLRTLLARYLDIPLVEARHISFSYNDYGKPTLPAPCSSTLNFNLSHSRDLALLAFTHGRQLGVDVEYMRAIREYEELAERFFSPHECATLQALPISLRQEAFYHCWTQKEAYIKARGMGLSLALDSFDVSVHPAEPAMLLDCRESANEVTRWKFYTLWPGTGYAAALAVEVQGPEERVSCWQLTVFLENL